MRPEQRECSAYFSTYVSLIPEGDIINILSKQIQETLILLKDTSETQGLFRYSPDKWSLKEVIGHMADTERILGYRLLCISRGETVSLPGFNQDGYVLKSSFDNQSVHDLLENLAIVRQSTLQLLKSLDQKSWLRRGTANNFEVTVRALASIIAGHELHHLKTIKDRYISSEAYSMI